MDAARRDAGRSEAKGDIDAFAGVSQGALYSYVRLRDDPSVTSPFNRTFAEADFDAIGAISSAPPAPTPVPEPATLTVSAAGCS